MNATLQLNCPNLAPRRRGRRLNTLFSLLAVCCLAHIQAATVLYTNNFELGAGPEWSDRKTTLTPVGYRQYLGKFGNGITNVFSLTNLPPHTNLTLYFDIYAIRSWDGNQGPDIWDIREVGNPTPLLRTSFSANNNRQSFPGSYPQSDFHHWSGASEVGTLGYTFDFGAGPVPCDAVYPVRLSFAHESNSLALQFSGALEGLADESWGLDNFAVVAGTPPAVHITSVTNNQGFVAPASLPIAVSVGPSEDSVQHVELYANQTLLTVFTNPPYSFVWSNVPAGMYTLRARARTVAGLWSDDLVAISVNGLRGDYFNNAKLLGTPVTRWDATINFGWGDAAPVPGIGSGNFSARWTGLLVPNYSETYNVSTVNDDGVRVWIGGEKLIDAWYLQVGAHTNQIRLEAGKPYPIMVEYYDGECCGAKMRLFWESASQPREIIPQSQLFPPASLPPALFSRQLGNQIMAILWTTNSAGYVLQSNATLSPASWTTNFSRLSESITNGMKQVTLSTTNSQMLFRLAK